MLDALAVDRVHVVGFSMGGGVALELYDIAPERVRSLTLLSAIGVQELELFGDYRLNHAIHGPARRDLAVARGRAAHRRLDDASFGLAYARNFYDTDQRPLRAILERFEPPMLIVHGEHDFLVPSAAALEHHRLVPQSELEMLSASHFMLFVEGPAMADRIASFVTSVDEGAARSRADASAQRRERPRHRSTPRRSRRTPASRW